MKKHDPKTGKFVRTKPDYKALYEETQNKLAEVESSRNHYSALLDREKIETHNLRIDVKLANERIEFLLDHCAFWVKWMYKRQFKK